MSNGDVTTGAAGNKPLEPKWLWYILSFIIPLLGIIFGIIYMKKPEPDVKKFGKTCLICALISVGLWCVCVIISMVTGGLASMMH